jgi:hypothetical protein
VLGAGFAGLSFSIDLIFFFLASDSPYRAESAQCADSSQASCFTVPAMSEESSAPMQFEAVGGHKSSIFYGESTRDGCSTLRKKTTAWEVLYYLAMELSREAQGGAWTAAAAAAGHCESDAVRTKFIQAAGKLSVFAPKLFSIHFPDHFEPKTMELMSCKKELGDWVVVEEGSPARSLLAPLFHELFDGAEALQGFDGAYDVGIWGIGLVNETSGMAKPCVMDVKIGFIRHSPLTPKDKVERMMKKESNSLMRDTALRICGCQRYVDATPAQNAASEEGGNERTCERFGKEIGYAISSVAELSNCLKLFLSSGVPLAEVTADGKLAFHPTALADVTTEEKTKMQQRISDIRSDIKAVLQFFEETPEGVFLLQHMAFVSASVLIMYDADSAASPATARLRLIDFARSTWRKFNFDEATIGFVQGLKNLDGYLA